tara:strand:- start:63 stop:470 length:408 start_codon:yes stop_codon:yes gene_type:complete
MKTHEIPQFVERYSALPAPILEGFTRPDDPRLVRRIEHHKSRVIDALGLSALALEKTVSIRNDAHIRTLPPKGFTLYEDIWFDDIQVLTSIIKRIGGGGLRSVSASIYPLQPETIERITALQEADEALTQAVFRR